MSLPSTTRWLQQLQPKWLNREQAAQYLNVTRSQIDRWQRAGKLKPSKPSGPTGRCYYLREDLDNLMKQSKVG